MKINIDKYQIRKTSPLDLRACATRCDEDVSRSEVEGTLFPAVIEKMQALQDRLAAENRSGLVVVLQAMDAAGKDSTVRHVFSQLNPASLRVTSFKSPNSEELDHDYLWRVNKALPSRGEIAIFNRSHYEDVVVTRIHNLVAKSQMPAEIANDANIWSKRYEHISNWESYLSENGFSMVKIFLNVSRDEQKKRLIERLDNKEKHWKFATADITEREYWDEYLDIYGETIRKTTTTECPWYVVPADNKWYTRYLVSLITLKALEAIDPQYPPTDPEVTTHTDELKKMLKKN